MTLKKFKYVAAKSLAQAGALPPVEKKAAFLAGGTDLLGALKDKIHPESPEVLVDLRTVPGMRYVKEDKKSLRIGALTPLTEIASHPAIRTRYQALAEAARSVASPQIRNVATVGGNICQEPRCWYYRTPDNQFHCLRKGGVRCGALLGDNRYHSIFGGVTTALPSCTVSCPGNVKIGDYMDHLRKGEFLEASRIILKNNPLPALTSRVCPHTCESGCNRRGFDEAVSIRDVERFLGDYILTHSPKLMKAPTGAQKKKSSKSVAIVGSGPAGLSAAYTLATAGYQVTVFERMAQAGGMLAYTIPAHRLAKELVKKQIAALERMGIRFELNAAIGKKELAALRKKFKGVFLATGAWRQKSLGIPKAELLISGMDFLTQIQLGKPPVLGKKVLIIGGGNVAIDVAISARHLGAQEVTMVCLEGRDKMPAYQEEIEEALREGVKILPSWGPHRVLETKGKVRGIELVRCTSVLNAQGRFQPSFDPNQKQTLEADQVILAIGQSTELQFLESSLKTERDLISVDPETQATRLPGLYAGGDVTSGPATVIHAIAAGRRAALAMDLYLRGGKKAPWSKPSLMGALLKPHRSFHEQSKRATRSDIGADAAVEANRCMSCHCIAVNASDLAPVLLALGAKIRTSLRTLRAEDFFGVGLMTCTTLKAGEIVKEIEIPAGSAKATQRYHKFRIRNSIDFPIVSLASVLESSGGKLKNARIVLGAVAPVPLRMKEVEKFLEGRPVNEETAAVAGELAVKEATALSRNGFKMQIVRALIKKAVLGEAP